MDDTSAVAADSWALHGVVGRLKAARPDDTDTATRLDSSAPPQRIDRFRVIERIGMGGMGIVYAAYDEQLDRRVAIKVVRHSLSRRAPDEACARLLREARALARLSHTNVVAVHDVGIHEGQTFLAMELVCGPTLRDWLNAERRDWPEILATFLQAGDGLAAAHDIGLVHRDFKPENVLIDDNHRPRVADFGLVSTADEITSSSETSGATSFDHHEPSVAMDGNWTRTGAVLGTPAYMSPEHFAGERLDARSDQFSFCAALFEALFKIPAFWGHTFETRRQAIRDGKFNRVPVHSKVPARIVAAIQRGLDNRPDRRWPNMGALLDELQFELARHDAQGSDPAVHRLQRRIFAFLHAPLCIVAMVVAGRVSDYWLHFFGLAWFYLGIYVMRRSWLPVWYLRQIVLLCVATAFAYSVHQAVGTALGWSSAHIQLINCILGATMCGLAGALIMRWIWWGTGLMSVGASFIYFVPTHASVIYAATNLACSIVAVLAWSRRRATSSGGPAASGR